MGRIKSKLIKRTGGLLMAEENKFSESFNNNKVILTGIMPSKKIRNQVAGYITRKIKNSKK